jgi:nitric oxide dioxygenase
MYPTNDTPPRTAEFELVKQSFRRLESDPEGLAFHLLARLFQIAPGIRSLFPANLRPVRAQFMDRLAAALQTVGRRHLVQGVRTEHYCVAGAALIWAVERQMGMLFSEEIEKAWWAAHRTVCAMMVHVLVELELAYVD